MSFVICYLSVFDWEMGMSGIYGVEVLSIYYRLTATGRDR